MPGLFASDFVPELARRYALPCTEEDLAADLAAAGVDTVERPVEGAFVGCPERPVPAME